VFPLLRPAIAIDPHPSGRRIDKAATFYFTLAVNLPEN
jgi:hypothetical protein